jgi:hypothetical protein
MRSIIRKAFVAGGAVLLCSAVTAQAMPSTLMKAKVPFLFVVNGQTFPAGTYTVERDMSAVLLIRGDTINQPTMFVSTVPDGGRDPAGSRPAFEFKRYENQYRLMTVWESGHEGWDIITR